MLLPGTNRSDVSVNELDSIDQATISRWACQMNMQTGWKIIYTARKDLLFAAHSDGTYIFLGAPHSIVIKQ